MDIEKRVHELISDGWEIKITAFYTDDKNKKVRGFVYICEGILGGQEPGKDCVAIKSYGKSIEQALKKFDNYSRMESEE